MQNCPQNLEAILPGSTAQARAGGLTPWETTVVSYQFFTDITNEKLVYAL